ncbi:hypothetical protein JXM67_08260 [candidate division WOR-3 bacterium]|nr:hypothetical protein [candidate division WOR-3 bacterium]
MTWDHIWQIAGPVAGGLIAAATGLGAYLISRALDRKRAEKDNLHRLRSFLLSYESELGRNLVVLERQAHDQCEHLEYLPVQGRDVMLYTLGQIPATQATKAVRFITESYTIFDEVNQLLGQVEVLIEHNGDTRQMIARRREFIAEKLPIVRWDLAQIGKILEEIGAPTSEKDLS